MADTINNEKIITLFKNKQVVMFCGAGISMAPPAGLPSWKHLRDATLEVLAQQNSHLKNHLALLKKSSVDKGSMSISPELLASYINWFTPNYYSSFRSLSSGSPNHNHRYLARLSCAGHLQFIITTNYDKYIEQAFIEDAPSIHLTVVSSEEEFERFYQKIKNCGIESNEAFLIKLHGCIDKPDTIIATAEQVFQGLPLYKKRAAQELFSHYWLSFWGYSGEDLKFNRDYLLMESLQNSSPGWIWSFYESKDKHKEVPNPTVQELQLLYGQERAYLSHNLFPRIFDEVIAPIPYHYTIEEEKALVETRNKELQTALNTWAKFSIGQQGAIHIFGFLLRHLGLLDEALSCFQRNFDICDDQNLPDRCASLNNIAMLYMEKREYESAERIYQESLTLAQSLHISNGRIADHPIAALNGIATIKYLQGWHEEAISKYQQALKICEGLDYQEIVARKINIINSLSGIFLAQGKHQEAIEYVEEGLRCCQKGGSIVIKAYLLTTLSQAYVRKNEMDKALPLQLDALKIARAIGHRELCTICTHNLWTDYTLIGNMQEAKLYEEENLRLSADLPKDLRMEENICIREMLKKSEEHNLAQFHDTLERYGKENNISGQISICRILALGYIKQEDYSQATTYCQQAVELSQKSHNLEDQILSSLILAGLYEKQGIIDKAMSIIEQNISLCQQHGFASYLRDAVLSLVTFYPSIRKNKTYYDRFIKIVTGEFAANTKLAIYNIMLGFVHYLEKEEDYTSLKELLNLLSAIAKESGHKTYIAQTAILLSDWHVKRGDCEKAFQCLSGIEPHFEFVEDKESLAVLYNNLGVVHKNNGDLQKALDLYIKAANLRELSEDKTNYAVTLANMARIYEELGNHSLSEKHAETAKKIVYEVVPPNYNCGTCYSTLGCLYSFKKDPKKAEDCFSKALKIYEEMGEASEIAKTNANLGRLYYDCGKKQKAREYLEQAKGIYFKMGAAAMVEQINDLLARINNSLPIVTHQSKIGRNDPCPCGSGQKYKKCCGKNK